ncbi:4'-phosphopantetheinyl transferase superfamily protein [Flavobacteriaceae bacterium F08102]|nr:4'-phosphopantetheinyl transferase superfamily protein [Flavobacteriaceae bacterium F08102]
MPLYKTIAVNEQTKVLIWKIEESLNDLSKDIHLTPSNQRRVDGMKSEIHRRGFMSVRHLLAEIGYTDQDLFYDSFGKPYLKDGNFISITHSFTFSGIIISKNLDVGIDIEMQRDKIVRIAHKFTPVEAYKTLANHDALVRKLTIVWGAKESLYKIHKSDGIGFLEHIDIDDFNFEDAETSGTVHFNNHSSYYKLYFLEFDGFTCVYGYELKKIA